jgi:hypothetical protein
LFKTLGLLGDRQAIHLVEFRCMRFSRAGLIGVLEFVPYACLHGLKKAPVFVEYGTKRRR